MEVVAAAAVAAAGAAGAEPALRGIGLVPDQMGCKMEHFVAFHLLSFPLIWCAAAARSAVVFDSEVHAQDYPRGQCLQSDM